MIIIRKINSVFSKIKNKNKKKRRINSGGGGKREC